MVWVLRLLLVLRVDRGLSLDLSLSVATHKNTAAMHIVIIHTQVELEHILHGLLLLLLWRGYLILTALEGLFEMGGVVDGWRLGVKNLVWRVTMVRGCCRITSAHRAWQLWEILGDWLGLYRAILIPSEV